MLRRQVNVDALPVVTAVGHIRQHSGCSLRRRASEQGFRPHMRANEMALEKLPDQPQMGSVAEATHKRHSRPCQRLVGSSKKIVICTGLLPVSRLLLVSKTVFGFDSWYETQAPVGGARCPL